MKNLVQKLLTNECSEYAHFLPFFDRWKKQIQFSVFDSFLGKRIKV